MATNDERRRFPGVHSSNEILSPQPFTPPSKEHLLATFDTAHVPPSDNGSATDGSQMAARDYEYNSSGSSTRHSGSDIFGREMDEDLDQLKSRASSRSSFSSMPASVLIHPINQMKSMPPMDLHEKMNGYTVEESEASFGDFDDPPRAMRTIRPREAAFRKPSSVRAMQMHTEDEGEDDDYLTPPRRRPGMRSPGSAGLKRSPYYSPNTSPNKQKVKKEYPLVLLHCNLLAPSLPVPAAADPQNQDLVEEVLPTQYWKRWRRLQEKVGSGVIRDRGVLISHPEDLYDMLEERLLESLELQRARVHQGHFLGHEESNPNSEGELSDQGESETDGEQGEECLDCGGRILRHNSDTNRKWEIKVFAANGLMRAGAWAAAWKEMEKVDVEVGLWLPSDVRRALEKRMAEAQTAVPKEEPQTMPVEKQIMHVDSRRPSVQEPVGAPVVDPVPIEKPQATQAAPSEHKHKEPRAVKEIALGTLLVNYIRVVAADKRNIALVVMTVLVAFLAMGIPQQHFQPAVQYISRDLEAASMAADVSEAVVSSSVVLPSSQPSNVYVPVADPVSIVSAPVPTAEVVETAIVEEDPVPNSAEGDEEVNDAVVLEEASPAAETSLEKEAPVDAENLDVEPEVQTEEESEEQSGEQEIEVEEQPETQVEVQPEEESEELVEPEVEPKDGLEEETETRVLEQSDDVSPSASAEQSVEPAVSEDPTEEPEGQPTDMLTQEIVEESVVEDVDETTEE